MITVSIGGNESHRASTPTTRPSAWRSACSEVEARIKTIMERLRAAAGGKPVIVGITYPDVTSASTRAARIPDPRPRPLSVAAFRDFINPALKRAYESQAGLFVDVTASHGSLRSVRADDDLRALRRRPVAVATVCRITYYCERRDIHAKAEGY